MDRLIVEEKLESLRRCVRRIEDRRARSAADLREDPDRQDILSLNLARAVQLCVDIAAHILAGTDAELPTTMGESFDRLAEAGVISEKVQRSMRAAVGFRNIAVHSYQAIDWEIVHRITHQGLEDFRAFARCIAAKLE